MPASSIVQELINETPTDDLQRLNKLFQLETLVKGLETDLRTYQERSAQFEARIHELDLRIEQLEADQNTEDVDDNQGEIPSR